MVVTRRKLHDPSAEDQGSSQSSAESPKVKPIPTTRKISALFFFALSAFIILVNSSNITVYLVPSSFW